MRICFFDSGPISYDFSTPFRQPLGGTESAVCYLGLSLKALDHEVIFSKDVGVARGCDIVIVVQNPLDGSRIRGGGFDGKLILWNGQDVDQSCIASLRDEGVVCKFDAIVHGSNWSKSQFDIYFPWTRSLSRVMRLGSGGAFCSQDSLKKEPLLVYMSTPYRGLSILVDAWPLIKSACPGYRLEVYSGMNLYSRGDEQFEGLYERVRGLEGVTHSECIGQGALAERISRAVVLAYPCTFRETFCVSLVDAMCCGCYPVISDLGALRGTSLGFGSMVRFGADNFAGRYAAEVVRVLGAVEAGELTGEIEGMVHTCRSFYDWGLIAREWVGMLEGLE